MKCPHNITVTCKKCLWARVHAAETEAESAREHGRAEGAAIVFGLIGMAEEIRRGFLLRLLLPKAKR